MTEAENNTNYADKLKETDINSLEIHSKEVDDDLVEPTSAETKALLWKLDIHIVPLMCLIYLCSFLGRFDIGRKMSMPTSDFNNSVSLVISFITYLLFEIPSNLILKRMGPSKWIPCIMLIRASVMSRMATVTSFPESLILCFILSLTETSLYSGFNFCFSLWYPRKERATRVPSYLVWCIFGARAFEGVLTIGIMQFDDLRCLCGQRWILIITCLPTLLLAMFSYVVLPELPENFKFLTKSERTILQRLHADARDAEELFLVWKPFGVDIPDSKLYTHSMIYICSTILSYKIIMGLFITTILFGLSFLHLDAWPMPLTAPAHALACFHFGETILHFRKEDDIEQNEDAV
ncbi:hypothetical protein NQZ79_g8003 [Umbelopsis isabellina]|nr:hypothetical protein NQZ79_g8003 [Umbelopsis isabellina]